MSYQPYSPIEFLELADDVCDWLGINSKNARHLLLNTCAQESHLGEYRRQIGMTGDNGAFGIMQIELATEKLVREYLFKNYYKIYTKLTQLYDKNYKGIDENLTGNDEYSVAIARCLYYSIKYPLPKWDDIEGQANYWNDYYNRNPDKGTPEEFIKSYENYVLPHLE
jgi:hypothetical protein